MRGRLLKCGAGREGGRRLGDDGAMATIVFVHAHPDDEASGTAGSMARASDEGHRVVLVVATDGDHGVPAAGLADGRTVADQRHEEVAESARVLGVSRVAWLGYADSGMTGWPQNSAPDALMNADVDEAAKALVSVLDQEDADIVTGYDWHGGYGHPDHVKVHHVARRAAELAGRRPRLLESTMNRTEMVRVQAAGRAAGLDVGDFDPEEPMDDGNPFGSTEDEITWRVDVSAYLDRKRASLEAHRSQATDIESFLAMPPDVFAVLFGHEHLIEPGVDGPMRDGWPFA